MRDVSTQIQLDLDYQIPCAQVIFHNNPMHTVVELERKFKGARETSSPNFQTDHFNPQTSPIHPVQFNLLSYVACYVDTFSHI